jgi:hypothetical protein
MVEVKEKDDQGQHKRVTEGKKEGRQDGRKEEGKKEGREAEGRARFHIISEGKQQQQRAETAALIEIVLPGICWLLAPGKENVLSFNCQLFVSTAAVEPHLGTRGGVCHEEQEASSLFIETALRY